jgi:hypothetical protein
MLSVAVVSVVTSGIVGVAGVTAAAAGGWRDRRHARQLAREERMQTHRGDAYVDLLELASLVADAMADLQRLLEYDPPLPRAPMPTRDAQARVFAKVDAYGSQEVLNALRTWRDTVDEIVRADSLIKIAHSARQHRDASHELSQAGINKTLELHQTLRPNEKAAREALQSAVRAELAS